MVKLILLTFFTFLFTRNVFSENLTIHLIPNQKNNDSIEITSAVQTSEELKIIETELNEDEEILVFDNNIIINSTDKEKAINNLESLSNTWKKSKIKNINFLIEKLNNNISSNIIKSNLTNTLIYGNIPPDGMSQEDFDKLRIITLKNLGNVQAAINVMGDISTYESNKDIYNTIVLEKSLNDYNLAALCGILGTDSKFNTDAYLLKIKIFCSFLNNKIEEADFFNSLLLEDDNDDYFQALYNKLIKIDNSLKSLQHYNYDEKSISLYSAIMRSTDIPFTEDFILINSPQLLRAIAISPITDISVRLEAAQKAYKFGSFDAESIAALYQSVQFSSEELNNPLNTVKGKFSSEPQKSMALLFQTSRIQILPISRLEALSNFWKYANSIGQADLAYKLSKNLLKSIDPTSELIDFAIQTSKAHLHNNSIDISKKWLKLIHAKIDLEEENKINKDYLQLIFLINLREGRYNIEEKLSENLFDNLDIKNEDINNLELYLTTLDFIGFDVPTALWEITAKKDKDNRKVPSIYVMKLLENSSSERLLGELLLCIAVSMEDNSWSEIHPQHVSIIFESLKNIGEDEIIKNLALEILENIG